MAAPSTTQGQIQSPPAACRVREEQAARDGCVTPPLPQSLTKGKKSRSALFGGEQVLEKRFNAECNAQGHEGRLAKLAGGAASKANEAAKRLQISSDLLLSSEKSVKKDSQHQADTQTSASAEKKRECEQSKQPAASPEIDREGILKSAPGSSCSRKGGARGRRRPVVQRNSQTNEQVCHRTLKDAAESAGTSPSTMCQVVQQQRPFKGCIWQYADEGDSANVFDSLGELPGRDGGGKEADGGGKRAVEGKGSNERPAENRRAKKKAKVINMAQAGRGKESKQAEMDRQSAASANSGLSACHLDEESGVPREESSGPATPCSLRERASPHLPANTSKSGAETNVIPDASVVQKPFQDSMDLSDIEGDGIESREGSVVFGANFEDSPSSQQPNRLSLVLQNEQVDRAEQSDDSASSQEASEQWANARLLAAQEARKITQGVLSPVSVEAQLSEVSTISSRSKESSIYSDAAGGAGEANIELATAGSSVVSISNNGPIGSTGAGNGADSLYFAETSASPALIEGSGLQLLASKPQSAGTSSQAAPSEFSSIANRPGISESDDRAAADHLLQPVRAAASYREVLGEPSAGGGTEEGERLGQASAERLQDTAVGGEAESVSLQQGIEADAGAALCDRVAQIDDGKGGKTSSGARLLVSGQSEKNGQLEIGSAMENLNLVAALLLDQSRREDDLRKQISRNGQDMQQASSMHAEEVSKLRKELEAKDSEIRQLKEEAERQASLVASMRQEHGIHLQVRRSLDESAKAACEAAAFLDCIEASTKSLAEAAEASASGAVSLSTRLQKAENRCSQSYEITKELQAVIAKMHKLDG